jgi:hypothetical protein
VAQKVKVNTYLGALVPPISSTSNDSTHKCTVNHSRSEELSLPVHTVVHIKTVTACVFRGKCSISFCHLLFVRRWNFEWLGILCTCRVVCLLHAARFLTQDAIKLYFFFHFIHPRWCILLIINNQVIKIMIVCVYRNVILLLVSRIMNFQNCTLLNILFAVSPSPFPCSSSRTFIISPATYIQSFHIHDL